MDRDVRQAGTTYEGVAFVEGDVPGAEVIEHFDVEISRQNANLFDIKRELALRAKECGANAIVNFRYGQRPHRAWQLVAPKWDTESWHGSGDAVRVNLKSV